MKRETLAEICFTAPVGRWPKGKFFAQAKLSSDPVESQFGAWDLIVDPVSEPDGDEPSKIVAFVGFLSPDAPEDTLRRGVQIELFHGVTPLGTALVLTSRSERVVDGLRRSDSDFLARSEAA